MKAEQENRFGTYKEATRKIIDKVNCPYQVFGEECTSEQVNRIYEEALQRGRSEGFVPVLVPGDDTLAEWLVCLDDEGQYSKEAVLKSDSSIGKEILTQRYEEYMEDYAEDSGDSETYIKEFMGEMADGDELVWLTSFEKFDKFDGDGIEETILFEIPVTEPWQVIAWVPMGGWNECPNAEEMIAICRYWYEKYGAVPAVISHDTIEFLVEEPVGDEDAAWEVAKEHYAFTPDRVDQCTVSGTLGEVADCIRKSTVWYFWWD